MILSISELINKPEGKTLEFKQVLSSPKNILKTLVAFANTAGGVLLVGVEDITRDVIGVENPLDEEERLCNLIADGIEPRLVPNIELIAWKDKTLLAVEVYPSGLRPHWLKNEGRRGVYVRLGSSNRQADQSLIEELKRSAAGAIFDELPLPELTIDSLDIKAARILFKDRRDLDEKELLTLKLLTRVQGRLVPTIGGILLFGKDREDHFSDAWVQCGRFIGKDKTYIFDHTEIHEHLPITVERVMEFLKKHALRGADLSQLYRRDIWSIPLSILREAVINAVVHADYSQLGAPIRISFFDDRIEIENPGILVPGLTVEDICQGVSRLRNRVIARVFRELNLIEQWGSGIRRMFAEAEKLGLTAPKIEELGLRYRFTVYLVESIAVPQITGIEPITPPVSPGVTLPVTLPVTPPVTPPVGRLLLALATSGEMGNEEIRECLGLKDRAHLREHYIIPALKEGLIEYTIHDKPNSRLQKYRLTAKGREILEIGGNQGRGRREKK